MKSDPVIGPESAVPRVRLGWLLTFFGGAVGLIVAATLAYARMESRSERLVEIVDALGARVEKGLDDVRTHMVRELREIVKELKRQDGAANERAKLLGILEERISQQDIRIHRLEAKIDDGK